MDRANLRFIGGLALDLLLIGLGMLWMAAVAGAAVWLFRFVGGI